MSNTLTLDDIRAAAEKKYGSTDLDLGNGKVVSLKNPLRLPKEKRQELNDLGDVQDGDDSDPIDYFENAFAIVSSKSEAKAIREAFGEDDVTLYVSLFESYSKGIEMGEASPSQD